MIEENKDKELLIELLQKCFFLNDYSENLDWRFNECFTFAEDEPELGKKLKDFYDQNNFELKD